MTALFETELTEIREDAVRLIGADGEPRELFSLRPDRMRVLADPTGWPTGWEYGAGGYKRRFERDPSTGRSQVFHMRLFHPSDDHYGLSPLEPAGRAVDLHTAGADWARALLDNAARPSGARWRYYLESCAAADGVMPVQRHTCS